MSLKCYYHPNREAITKCENCEKMICIECKKPISVTHGVQESRYATQHDFCMPCYYDSEMKNYDFSPRGYYIFASIVAMSVVIFIILALISAFSEIEGKIALVITFSVFTFISTVLFLSALKSFFKNKGRFPVMLAELKTKKENFLKTLRSSNVCPECGNKIEVGFSICPSCGYNLAG